MNLTPGNKRQSTRHEVRGQGKLQPLDEKLDLDPAIDVQVRDVGRTGVLFDVPCELEVNSTWRLRLVVDGHLAGTIPLLVRHTTATEAGTWRVGAQVIIEPIMLTHLGVRRDRIRFDPLADGVTGSAAFSAPPGADEIG